MPALIKHISANRPPGSPVIHGSTSLPIFYSISKFETPMPMRERAIQAAGDFRFARCVFCVLSCFILEAIHAELSSSDSFFIFVECDIANYSYLKNAEAQRPKTLEHTPPSSPLVHFFRGRPAPVISSIIKKSNTPPLHTQKNKGILGLLGPFGLVFRCHMPSAYTPVFMYIGLPKPTSNQQPTPTSAALRLLLATKSDRHLAASAAPAKSGQIITGHHASALRIGVIVRRPYRPPLC